MVQKSKPFAAAHRAVGLRCEFRKDPLGIDEVAPRLSWRMEDSRAGARQSAYRLVAASSPERLLEQPDLWDSGRVPGDQSLDVVYRGKSLASRQQVFWRVRTWDSRGAESEWSRTARFECGLLEPGDWVGQWIGRPLTSREGSQPCPYLRRAFELKGGLRRARIYVTARGIFELHLNGQRVGQDYFTPGWTEYRKRIQYLVYEVGSLLAEGPNALGAILGDGWYAGHLVEKQRFRYGDQLSLLLQLEVDFEDGRRVVVASGPEWRTAFGPLLRADFYHGECYDARREFQGWARPGFDDRDWAPAQVFPPPQVALVGLRCDPVRRQEELAVRQQTEPRFGVHVFDLGQNMVGWVRLKVRGHPGQAVTIRHAEMLNPDGTLYTANLRSAECTDRYICRGGGEEVYEPRFTFHGFRYVEVTGLMEKPCPADVTGVVLHSQIPATGSFECSEPLVNRLQQNILWGQKGNFLEVPTDCPQRDERLGWTGDAQVFIRTACFNRDVAAFFTKWCIDLEDAQYADGAFPHVAPDVIRKGPGAAAAWADAGVICPWTIYLCYGDVRILERQYPSMVRWLEWRLSRSPQLIAPKTAFGDWLAIDIAQNNPGRSPTPRDLIGTAYFAHTTELIARSAKRIGREEEARKYAELAGRIRAAFNREFVSPNGRLAGDTQTAYLLALAFDLLPVSKRKLAAGHLAREIEERQVHLSTGFVGTPLLAPVLSRHGRPDLAYKLLLQQSYPSWLYTVLQGATTMWERWNSYTKEGGFGEVAMNSFNHYAYGAIGEWLYNTVAGIELDPSEPGYKHVILRPLPGQGISSARAALRTRYGLVACSWTLADGQLQVSGSIPPNTHATLWLPGQKPKKLRSGSFACAVPNGLAAGDAPREGGGPSQRG